MNSLLKRSLSGLIFVLIVAEGTVASVWSFYAVWVAIGVISVVEFMGLVGGFSAGSRAVSSVRSVSSGHNSGSAPMSVLGGGLWWKMLIGVVYITIPICMILSMDQMMVLTFVTIVWANDTGAYLVGSRIGKHKMAPSISPKKSWEGFFGGLLFAVGVSLVWYSLYWSQQNPDGVQLWGEEVVFDVQTKLLWALFGLLIGLAAVAGDLVESKFKRVLGVKNSGRILPGHGGMLDRMDATFLAAVVAWVYVVALALI